MKRFILILAFALSACLYSADADAGGRGRVRGAVRYFE
jgi:hypothetical protein